MVPEHVSLGDLISVRSSLMVPVYQRGYAWDEEEVNDFCSDIEKLWAARLAGRPANHFFGGIVTIVHTVAGNPGHKYEIVDGQQRLATFGLLLAVLVAELRALANLATSLGNMVVAQKAEGHATLIENGYLEYQAMGENGIVRLNRIELSKVDRAQYSAILGNPAVGLATVSRVSHQRLEKARGAVITIVRTGAGPLPTSIPEQLVRLEQLEEAILKDCSVIHIMSQDRREAYRLFSVLNNRGRNLGVGDLLRASTLEAVAHDPTDHLRVEQSWDEILSSNESRVEDFLVAAYASAKGQRPKQHELFESLEEQFFPRSGSASQHSLTAEMLRGQSRVYSRLREGEWPYEDPKACDWERARLPLLIETLDHTLCLPLLLATYDRLQEADFARVVHLLERVAFRYVTICRVHVTPLSRVYLEHCKLIRTKPNYEVDSLAESLRDLVKSRAGDSLFQSNLREQLVYKKTKGNLIRYFFATLEHYRGSYSAAVCQPDKTFSLDLHSLTLEHIYPQRPLNADSVLQGMVDALANLTILAPGDNAALGNSSFDQKQAVYASSRLRINRDIAEYAQWDMDALIDREAKLLEAANKVFGP